MRRIPVGTLAEGLALLRASASHSPIAYTWHGVAPVSRGIVYAGALTPGPPVQRNIEPHYQVLTAKTRAQFPFSLWGPRTTQAVNTAFWHLESRRQEYVKVPLFDSLFPFARRTAYFRFYGRRGLAESQMLIPQEQAEGFLAELQQRILKMEVPAVMMSLKLFKGTQRLLRFDGDGVCVTLDLVRSLQTLAFLSILDELLIAAHGIPNVVKDSRLPRAVVRACYTQYEAFRDQLYTYDPSRTFRSELSERLGL
jgi:decaprenylphospho-beta-D-ribofuranose 2-oxidase